MGEFLDFDEYKREHGDRLVRGIAANGTVRAFAVTARQTVQAAHDRHQTSPVVTAALGRLMMGAQMLAAMAKGQDELLTISVRGDGPIGGLTVTADTAGHVKGYANHPDVWIAPNAAGKLDVGGGIGAGTLTVVRDHPGVEPYHSQVALANGEIGDDLALYLTESDQIPSAVGLGVLVGTDQNVLQAGGFIVQMMPGYDEATVDALEARIAGLESVTDLLEQGQGPEDVLQQLLDGMDFELLDTMPVSFYCGCNNERAIRMLLTLGTSELEDMIEQGQDAEVRCDFCGNRFAFSPAQMRDILDNAR